MGGDGSARGSASLTPQMLRTPSLLPKPEVWGSPAPPALQPCAATGLWEDRGADPEAPGLPHALVDHAVAHDDGPVVRARGEERVVLVEGHAPQRFLVVPAETACRQGEGRVPAAALCGAKLYRPQAVPGTARHTEGTREAAAARSPARHRAQRLCPQWAALTAPTTVLGRDGCSRPSPDGLHPAASPRRGNSPREGALGAAGRLPGDPARGQLPAGLGLTAAAGRAWWRGPGRTRPACCRSCRR